MKWYMRLLAIGLGVVLMPAAAFSFAGFATMKSRETAQSPQKPENTAKPETKGPAQEPKQKLPTHVGKAVEVINAKDYTYILLEKKNGDKHWFAVPLSEVKVGQEVEFTQGLEMGQFKSTILNRTFDGINFSSGVTVKEDDETIKKRAHAGIMKDAKANEGGAAEAPIKVDKATGPNAFTVGELYLKKAELTGKKVLVRGKVVKVSAHIMKRNWIHLQDGTGEAAKGTNNLVITSNDLPAVGDIVTVSGEFFQNKDFGNGYKYDAIIENAAFQH